MPESQGGSIGTELPKEMARVRDKIMPLYQEIGPAGVPGLMLMRRSEVEFEKIHESHVWYRMDGAMRKVHVDAWRRWAKSAEVVNHVG